MHPEPHLQPREANFQPLSPVSFLLRAVELHPDRPAVVHGERVLTWRDFDVVTARMAGWLASKGVKEGDVVSVISTNRPELLAAHYAIPGLSAVLNAVNTRLDDEAIAYILTHCESRILIADPSSADLARRAAKLAGVAVAVIGEDVDFLADDGLPQQALRLPADEWLPICINYTSGTTGKPKGAVYHHRGAYLNAMGNAMALQLNGDSAYLWTLPMFHCNGWCHTWAVTLAGGLHVCIEKIDPEAIFDMLIRHEITHFSCAPVVLYMVLNHPAREEFRPRGKITVATGGASPTASLIAELNAIGIELIHLYGLTESFGPTSMRVLTGDMMDAAPAAKAEFLARQGHRHPTANHIRVIDEAGNDVPADGRSLGEIILRGNTLMQGYYKDSGGTSAAFSGGWFHTGDLAVLNPDGAIEIRDRSKDIIISGGENISSLEIESVLHQSPDVLLAAVVAAPDPKWGEIPCAFIELKPGCAPDADGLQEFCFARIARYKVPRRFIFRELPKTATGKIQKYLLRKELTS